jgi:hypothetical protein
VFDIGSADARGEVGSGGFTFAGMVPGLLSHMLMAISHALEGFSHELDRAPAAVPAIRWPRTLAATAAPGSWALTFMVCITLGAYLFSKIHQAGSWLRAANWLDNGAYIAVAKAIHTGQWSAPNDSPTPFFGFPLTIVALTHTAGVNESVAIIAISLMSVSITCACLSELYGPAAVLSLLLLSWDWVGIGVLGGSEAPFCACLFAAFLCARSGRWRTAATIAAVATTVRPVGVFALVALFLTRIRRHEWRTAVQMTLIGLTIGLIYFALVGSVTGDPWINFRTYRGDWSTGWPVGPPFIALIDSAVPLVRRFGWWSGIRVMVIVAATAAAGMHVAYRSARGRWPLPEAESIFAVLIVGFLLCYPYRNMAYEWPRFLIPAIPILTAAHRSIVPASKRFWWPAVLANAGVLGTAWLRVLAP